MLKSFAPKDRADFKDDKVEVTCEFCSSVYRFTPHEAGVERRGQSAACPPSIRDIAAEWWARGALSSGAHSRDPVALPTLQFAAISLVGQITQNLSSPFCKNILLSFSRKSRA